MPRLLVQREACRVVTRTFGIWYPQAATPPKASDSVRCRSLRLPPLGCAAVAVCPPARSPRPPAAGRAADRGGLRAAWSAAASVVKVYPELRGARALPGRPYAEASGRPGVIFPQHDRSTPKSGPRARGAQGADDPDAAPAHGAARGPPLQTWPPRTGLRAGHPTTPKTKTRTPQRRPGPTTRREPQVRTTHTENSITSCLQKPTGSPKRGRPPRFQGTGPRFPLPGLPPSTRSTPQVDTHHPGNQPGASWTPSWPTSPASHPQNSKFNYPNPEMPFWQPSYRRISADKSAKAHSLQLPLWRNSSCQQFPLLITC